MPCEDLKSPYTFKEWSLRNRNLSHKDYEDYIKTWTAEKAVDQTLGAFSYKRDLYISLLERLNVLFAEDPEIQRVKVTDFNDMEQIKCAIPIYAKKLYTIARYYNRRREHLKNAYKRYSMRNTKEYIENTMYNYFREIVQDKTTQEEELLRCFAEFEKLNQKDPALFCPQIKEEYYLL